MVNVGFSVDDLVSSTVGLLYEMDSWMRLNTLINRIAVTLFSLVPVIFISQTTIAELVVKPTDTEALVDQPTYFNCSTSVVLQDVQWFHFPIGPNEERNFVYGYDQFYNQYKDRFAIEKNAASGTFNLIIGSVQVQDAGRYECQDDAGRGVNASAQLIVLDKSPTCHSNQKTNEVIGPNECGIAQGELHLTCSATYHGDDAPVLNWFKDGSDQPLVDGVSFSSSENQSLSNLTLKPDSIKDDSTFHCQTTRSKPKPFGCTSGSFAIVGTSNTKPCVAAILVTWLLLIPIIVAASIVGGMYLQTRHPLKIFNRQEKEKDIEWHQTLQKHVPKNSDVVECAQPFIVPENTRKSTEEHAKQYEELKRTMQLAKDNDEKELKLAQLEKKIKQLEKEKRELEERLYPQAIASYSKKPKLVSTIEIKDLKPNSTKDTKPIFGMMILNNKLFVVTEKSSNIEVYDSITFKPERRWPIPQMSNPLDIAGCRKSNCLYICESRSNEIVILRIDSNQTALNEWSIGEEADHLSVSRDANVVVSLFTENKINEYSPEGVLIREVKLSPADNISHLWHAIKTTSMHFIFSHGKGNDSWQRVCVAHADGKVVKSFGGKKGSGSGIEKEHMNRPVHILEDSSHNLMVADMKNNRVLLLSSTLEYKGILLSKENKLRFPMRVCLDEERGILFVADNDYTEGKHIYDSGRILIFNCKKEKESS